MVHIFAELFATVHPYSFGLGGKAQNWVHCGNSDVEHDWGTRSKWVKTNLVGRIVNNFHHECCLNLRAD